MGVTLRFGDPALEAAFVEQEDLAAQRRGRIACVGGVLGVGGFVLLDPAVLPGELGGAQVVRAVVVVLLALLAWRFRPSDVRAWPVLVAAAILVVTWGLAALVPVADAPLPYVTGGLTISALGAYAIAGPRFRIALPTAVLVLAGFAVAVATADDDAGVRVASSLFALAAVANGLIACWLLEDLRRRQFLDARRLEEERARSDRLLHNVLPAEIATRLRVEPGRIADAADEVTVVFADIIGSTPLAERLPPAELVGLLDALFRRMDDVCRAHGAEKIKTIGDAYMAVVGLVRPDPRHADTAVAMASGWLRVARDFEGWPGGLQLRIGVHSGPVVAGVIGTDKFAYDLWGDTVNTASRLESHGCAGRVHLSAVTLGLLQAPPPVEARDAEIKGKGRMRTYLLDPA